MIAKILSGALLGINGYIVDVEVDISPGIPRFDLVGLPDSSLKESKERVRAAIKNSGYIFPVKRLTVNLAPADIRKEGPSFDLPIALGILNCIDMIEARQLSDMLIAGELSLDGSLRAINGVLPMISSAKENGIKRCMVPCDNAAEAALVPDIEVIGVKSLKEAVDFFTGAIKIEPTVIDVKSFFDNENSECATDFSDILGQDNVKRAIEVAAAGAHNILLSGPPGSGKTMMSQALPGILPTLSFKESIDITKIYSVAGLLDNKHCLITTRPFRAPHHSASSTALVGGGRIPRPGEVRLAHNGVLFLDELPEFPKSILEALRQPIEDRSVTISRIGGTLTYPSDFMLVGAMNPCPCGHLGNEKKCRCTPHDISKYLKRISGPLLDRIDIQIEASGINYKELCSTEKAESSASIKARIMETQKIQQERYADEGILFNSQLSSRQIKKFCKVGKAESSLLKNAFDNLGLSARAYHRILKVARTIADIDKSQNILIQHLAEAIQYRSLDRKLWR